MKTSIATDPSADLDLLRDLCHAFASTQDLEEATSSTMRWARAALRHLPSQVRVYLADSAGDLHRAGGATQNDRWGEARNRAFRSRSLVRHELSDRDERSIGFFPLMCRGEALGVMEVEAATSALEGSMPTMQAVVSQSAIAISNARRSSYPLDLSIAVTAHELRTPLLGAKAAVERLAVTTRPAPENSGTLREVSQELEQLAQMVDRLLRWSAGPGSIERQPTDLIEVVRESIASSDEVAEDRVRLSSPEQMTVWVDRPHLRGAISNVISNALLYSPVDGQVEIAVSRRDGWAEIVVIDRGAGVSPDERDSIFEPLSRGRAARESGRPGGGLGLFITRRVIEGHGGTISVESNGLGTTFTIRLPETKTPN